MSQMENRVRPRTYKYPDRKRIADLIRQHGARGTRELLARQICHNTLLIIAKEFNIELKVGRRPRKKAA